MDMLALIDQTPATETQTVPRPLAYIAPARPLLGGRRSRTAAALAAVLEEFGFATHTGTGSAALGLAPGDETALERAAVVICDVVRPRDDLPVEVALAAVRGLPVIALVPSAADIDGLARDVLADCRGRIVRYDAAPHQALHQVLARR